MFVTTLWKTKKKLLVIEKNALLKPKFELHMAFTFPFNFNLARAFKECSVADGWAKHEEHDTEVSDYTDCFDTSVSNE